MNKKTVKQLCSTLLAAILTAGTLPVYAMASNAEIAYETLTGQTAVKISNPENDANGIDGLDPEEDRENSYAWAMGRLTDDTGNYIYIGSNRNFFQSVLYSGMEALNMQGLAALELYPMLFDMLSNGEIPSVNPEKGPESLYDARIFRYNMENDEIELWFDPSEEQILGYRIAVEFQGDVYIGGVTTNNESLLYRISSNDQAKPELVASYNGGNIRAITVSEDGESMYVAVNENRFNELQNPMLQTLNIHVYEYSADLEEKEIASPEEGDFPEYFNVPGMALSMGDAWSIIEYEGDLYLSVITKQGAVVLLGEKNGQNWEWREYVGNTQNGAEYSYGFGNPVNAAIGLTVYGGELYFLTYSNALGALYSILQTVLPALIQPQEELSGRLSALINGYTTGLTAMQNTLDNETSVFRLTKNGNIEMVVGDEDMLPDGCGIRYKATLGAGFNAEEFSTTLYSWSAAEFNGELYIGTWDAYTLYKYFSKVTNGDLFEMTTEEFESQLWYTYVLLSSLYEKLLPVAVENPMLERILEQAAETLGPELTDMAAKTAEELVAYIQDEETVAEAIELLAILLDRYFGKPTTNIVAILLENTPDFVENLQALIENLRALKENIPDDLIPTAGLPNVVDSSAITFVQSPLPAPADIALNPALVSLFSGTIDILEQFVKTFTLLNPDGLATYASVSTILASAENYGFELWKSVDGENWEAVALDGFGSEFNFGIRNMIATEKGLYIGTANPFYGAQLWKLDAKEVEKEPESTRDSSFKLPKLYRISLDIEEGGSAGMKNDTLMIAFGSSRTLRFTPDEGYEITDVIVNGKHLGAVSQYTIKGACQDYKITVSFAPIAADLEEVLP